MRLEEITGVMLDYDGAPVSFIYMGNQYLTASRPVRWYARKSWWEDAGSIEKGIGAQLLETEMWRLWAISKDQRIFFELVHNQPAGGWEVNQINRQ